MFAFCTIVAEHKVRSSVEVLPPVRCMCVPKVAGMISETLGISNTAQKMYLMLTFARSEVFHIK